MSSSNLRGKVYRCPICGAEIAVLAHRCGDFHPLCCNVDMVMVEPSLVFYVCPHCKAEVALVDNKNEDTFAPMCCNVPMIRQAT